HTTKIHQPLENATKMLQIYHQTIIPGQKKWRHQRTNASCQTRSPLKSLNVSHAGIAAFLGGKMKKMRGKW
ncbi:MAG: hypothetical protein ACI30X_00340, partial [Muribaculaceae bacterium]